MAGNITGLNQLMIVLCILTFCHILFYVIKQNYQTVVTHGNRAVFQPAGIRTFRTIDKWIVVDSTETECEKVNWEPLSQVLNQWNMVVVVREAGTTSGCNPPMCIEISHDSPVTNSKLLSWTTRSKETTYLSAYVWVMSQGAVSILDVKCSFFFSPNIDGIFSNILSLELNKPYLLYKNSSVFDPLFHFGYYTYDEIRKQYILSAQLLRNQSIYLLETPQRLYIKHGFSASWNHGVKGILQKGRGYLFNTPVYLGDDVFFHFSRGPTLFLKPAFWFLFRPPGMNLQQTALFRSIWLFSIRRDFHIEMSVHDCSDENEDKNTSYSFLRQYQENNLTLLLQCVQRMRCSRQELQSHACVVRQLQHTLRCMKRLVEGNQQVGKSLFYFMKWIETLVSLRLNLSEAKNNYFTYSSSSTPVKFSLLNQDVSPFTHSHWEKQNKHVFQRMVSMCPNNSKGKYFPKSLLNWQNPRINDVMLVVVLNYETVFGAVRQTEYIHRPIFKYIVYCGPALEHFVKFADDLGLTYLTYIEGLPNSWLYMYECLAHAMKLGAPVKGYLHIGDDVLLNVWNIYHLDRYRLWIPEGFKKSNFNKTNAFINWEHWGKLYGRSALVNVFENLKNISEENSTSGKTNSTTKQLKQLSTRFLANYEKNIGLENVLHGPIDFLYIPSSLKEDYTIASDFFRSHGCFIELAVPAIHLGITLKKDVIYVKSESLWGRARLAPWKFYSLERDVFLHPFKAMENLKTLQGQDFYCNVFLKRYERFLSSNVF